MNEALFSEDHDIVVAGGGIAGLAVARALRRKGIGATVFERLRDASDGLAINLPGNAISALRSLGLGDELLRHGRRVGRREYRTASGRLLFRVDEDAFWGVERSPRCMRRSDLLAMLAMDLPAGSIRRGTSVSGVSEQEDAVELAFSDGSTTGARLFVGADGVRSPTRVSAFGGHGPVFAGLATASWRFIVPNPGVDCWTLWAGRDTMLLLIPVDGGEVYGWAAATGARASSPDGEILAGLVRDFPESARAAVDRALSTPGGLHHSPLEEVRLDRWFTRRIVLVGDAAHATAPVWAEGAALAMEDALVLAEVVARGGDLAGVGHAFETRRRERIQHVRAMTDRMSNAARLPTVVRNLLMPFVGPRSYQATYRPLMTEVV